MVSPIILLGLLALSVETNIKFLTLKNNNFFIYGFDNNGTYSIDNYDFNKIINGDYYEQDPRSLGSGSLPASEMGAFSNMQNTNTFNLFNPDTYPTFGEVMFGSNYGKWQKRR